MNVIDIVSDYLEKNGFDGLCSDGECACLVGDLVPCCGDFGDCQPGYKRVPSPDEKEWEGYDWIITSEKPPSRGRP